LDDVSIARRRICLDSLFNKPAIHVLMYFSSFNKIRKENDDYVIQDPYLGM